MAIVSDRKMVIEKKIGQLQKEMEVSVVVWVVGRKSEVLRNE